MKFINDIVKSFILGVIVGSALIVGYSIFYYFAY